MSSKETFEHNPDRVQLFKDLVQLFKNLEVFYRQYPRLGEHSDLKRLNHLQLLKRVDEDYEHFARGKQGLERGIRAPRKEQLEPVTPRNMNRIMLQVEEELLPKVTVNMQQRTVTLETGSRGSWVSSTVWRGNGFAGSIDMTKYQKPRKASLLRRIIRALD